MLTLYVIGRLGLWWLVDVFKRDESIGAVLVHVDCGEKGSEGLPSVMVRLSVYFVFFFQAEDGIRDLTVTGVQTCALPILATSARCVSYLVSSVSHSPSPNRKRRLWASMSPSYTVSRRPSIETLIPGPRRARTYVPQSKSTTMFPVTPDCFRRVTARTGRAPAEREPNAMQEKRGTLRRMSSAASPRQAARVKRAAGAGRRGGGDGAAGATLLQASPMCSAARA